MTTLNTAAMLTSVIFIKGSLIVAGALLLGRVARTASRGSMIMSMAFAAMIVVPVLGAMVPTLNEGFVSLNHGAAQEVAVGLVAIWGLGVLVLMGRLVRDLRAAQALVSRASGRMGNRVTELLRLAARAVGVTRIPELRETTELATVALIGFRRPVLLIPAQARQWSDEELFGILCHELEHVRRGDWMMLMIEQVVAALYWPNPLIHLVRRQAWAVRESAADDAAMRAGAGAAAYAGRLISVARDLKRAPRFAVSVAFAEGGGVERRVRALFDERDRRRVSPLTLLRAGLVAIPLIAVLAVSEPWICLPGGTTSSSICP